jgi:choline dehydrogenase-like flavoprotein
MMEMDARTLPDGSPLTADVCIIGAGAAGISAARELAGLDIDVLLLESGGIQPDPSVQDLNEGTVVGDAYAGLRATRHRGAGGSIHLWNTPVLGRPGAKYVPLDPVDFEERPGLPRSGWPFDRSHLEPFYRKAQIICDLGPFAYDAADWSAAGRPALTLAGGEVTTRIYQFGAASALVGQNLTVLRSAHNVRVCHHATACALEADGTGRRFVGARVVDGAGRPLAVRAGTLVLAAGAIENARLLLVSGGSSVSRNDWVGRCFMEHPRDYALTVFPHSPELFGEAAFYDRHTAHDGTIIGGRLALTNHAVAAHGLPNASVTLLPRAAVPPGWARALDALRRLGRPPLPIGYGWSEVSKPDRAFDAFRVIVNL